MTKMFAIIGNMKKFSFKEEKKEEADKKIKEN